MGFSHLKVFVPEPEYLLAMKAMAIVESPLEFRIRLILFWETWDRVKNVNPDKRAKTINFQGRRRPLFGDGHLPERLAGVKGRIRASSQEGQAGEPSLPFFRITINMFLSISDILKLWKPNLLTLEFPKV